MHLPATIYRSLCLLGLLGIVSAVVVPAVLSTRNFAQAAEALDTVGSTTNAFSADIKWVTYDREDATQHTNSAKLLGTTSSLAACEDLVEKTSKSYTIMSWNTVSHHCYGRSDGDWKPLPNPRVVSACAASKVKGCGSAPPTPPGPSPSPPPPPPGPSPPPQPKIPALVNVPGGTFTMGYSKTPLPSDLGGVFPNGDADEQPYHQVTVGAFRMGATEVTNAQYEQYDPAHKALRGKLGFSTGDNDAVVFVTYEDAVNYTLWLTRTTSTPFRLPTEAEWEYAARGNSSTARDYFWTGNSVPPTMQNNQKKTGIPDKGLPLGVARFAPNSYGLFDTIGNVEEWCADWHGPYSSSAQTDPKGAATGVFRVTRGGSHSTSLYYLRTANRAGALATEKNWYIGFRVAADVTTSSSSSSAATQSSTAAELAQQDKVASSAHRFRRGTKSEGIFAPGQSWPNWDSTPQPPIVRRYVNIPSSGSYKLPFNDHNHEPTVAACPNGDVIASWYSTNCGEPGRCTGLVSARLSKGATSQWPVASVQLDAPDRCQCCTAYYRDPATGKLYHFSAMSAAGTYDDIMVVLQESDDCGQTFTEPKIIWPDHGILHQIVVTVIKNAKNEVMIPCDHWGIPPYTYEGDQSVVQHAPIESLYDTSAWHVGGGRTNNWTNTGSHHSSIVELRNGSYVAVGRGHDIAGTMAFSISKDGGYSWAPHASSFPGIHSGQREVMIRLGSIDQPIMHCTFSNGAIPMYVKDSAGGKFPVTGLYCALSFDEGETFPARRTITDDLSLHGHSQEGFDGRNFTMNFNTSEPDGYMAATVGPTDGLIHLITSRNHYAFNLAWLNSTAPPPPKN